MDRYVRLGWLLYRRRSALDELRCDECVWGRETNDLFSGGVALDDDIVAVFEMSAESEASVSEQIAMQLEDCIWGRGM